MENPDFPSNSGASKHPPPSEKKKIEQVTSGAVRRKRSLRKQISETFVGGDIKSASRYTLFEVFMPWSKDMIFEMVTQGFRMLMFGDSRRGGGATRPQSGDYGYVNYRQYSAPALQRPNQTGPQRAMSRAARSKFNFDEVVLDDRVEAEEVLEQLYELVSHYGSATVADLYELVGLRSEHTDHRWGWTDLHGSGISRIRGGYLLDLPEPEPID